MAYFCVLIISTFSINICGAKSLTDSANQGAAVGKTSGSAAVKKAAGTSPAVSSQDEGDTIPHITDWRGSSLQADKLIDQKKFVDAETILNSILPRAKSDAPQSVDYALTLCRLGTDLYLLEKYPSALARINEAMAILDAKPPSVRQRKVTWRTMLTKIAILLAMGHYSEAETLARKTVAYAIAFPDSTSSGKLKIAYSLLRDSLVKQKKVEEASKVSEIINNL